MVDVSNIKGFFASELTHLDQLLEDGLEVIALSIVVEWITLLHAEGLPEGVPQSSDVVVDVAPSALHTLFATCVKFGSALVLEAASIGHGKLWHWAIATDSRCRCLRSGRASNGEHS